MSLAEEISLKLFPSSLQTVRMNAKTSVVYNKFSKKILHRSKNARHRKTMIKSCGTKVVASTMNDFVTLLNEDLREFLQRSGQNLYAPPFKIRTRNTFIEENSPRTCSRSRSNSTFDSCMFKQDAAAPRLLHVHTSAVPSTQIIHRESREVQHAPMHSTPATHREHVVMN